MIFGQTVSLLDQTFELVSATGDLVQIVISEIAPFLLDLAFQLLPISLDSVPVHATLRMFDHRAIDTFLISNSGMNGFVPRGRLRSETGPDAFKAGTGHRLISSAGVFSSQLRGSSGTPGDYAARPRAQIARKIRIALKLLGAEVAIDRRKLARHARQCRSSLDAAGIQRSGKVHFEVCATQEGGRARHDAGIVHGCRRRRPPSLHRGTPAPSAAFAII